MNRDALAPNLFLVLHDPFTGRPRINGELLGCGLVAAELAELVMAGRLSVEHERVVVVGRGGRGDDGTGAYVVDCVARQKGVHTPRTWVGSLGDALFDLTARGLESEGVVRRERRRGLVWWGRDRYPAQDLLVASSPRNRLQHMLAHPEDIDLNGAVLAAVLHALRAERVVESDTDAALFGEIRAQLPTTLQDVVAGLADARAAVSLTVRR